MFNPRHTSKSSITTSKANAMLVLFPTLLIILDIGAAWMYFRVGDTRHVIYWLAAAVLTAAVTY